MEIQFWGKIFESGWLPKIFDFFAVFDENGNFLNIEKFESIHSTKKGFIFLVARSIDNHDESTVPTVLEVISESIKINLGKESFQKVITDAYKTASERIRNSPKIQSYGASVIAVYVKGNKAIISHIGDNRCYLFRNEITGQITNDNTLAFELIKEGAEPNSPISLACLKAIGCNIECEIDFIELDLKKGDKLILITRQLWLITNEHYSWVELRKFFADLFDNSEFINETKVEIIKQFIGEKKLYDSPILIFQVN